MIDSGLTRRSFVKGSAVAAAAACAPSLAHAGWLGRPERLRIGVIGCGGRGTGAALNCLEAHPSTELVALADLFEDRLNSSRQRLADATKFGTRSQVDDERCHVGFDAYQRVIEQADIDLVILTTPPHFRPIHFDASVKAGKHVFMEKPVAVDPTGIRQVIAAASVADSKGLRVVTGTQRRHEQSYIDLMRRVHDGEIGDLVSARCYWNQGGLWVHERKPEYSDMEWQVRNWLYFAWLSGDHIVEQHVHNLDVINWAMGTPVECVGMGGREVRTHEKYGNIFDHHAVEFLYADGRHVLSTCRQIDGTAGKVEEVLHGSKGRTYSRSGYSRIDGGWESEKPPNPYVQEHRDLIDAILNNKHLNEARQTAESTLMAIMGRMATYTGKKVTWEHAMQSTLDLAPSTYEFCPLAVAPIAVPGRTPLE